MITQDDARAPAVRRLATSARRLETRHKGGRVVWRIWGEGPPVVMLHGGFGSWMHFLRTIPALAESRRVICPDMPGFGESDDPAGPDLLDAIPAALASGLARFAEAHEWLDVAAFSFGTVMSGALAVRMARAAPAGPRVRRLALCAPAGLGVPMGGFDGLRSLRAGMSQAERLAVHRHNLSRLMLADPALIDEETVLIQDANVGAARAVGRPYSRSSALKDALALRPVEAVAAIWGSRDAYALRNLHAYEAAIRGLVPDIRAHRIEGAGHWVLYERPGEVNRVLLDFLNE
ncbi:alpha/beta fold hydrolase [Ferruginivarius sediminum]|nr:alpha/beta fold hydrolase [Ferruginivarius sediminum]